MLIPLQPKFRGPDGLHSLSVRRGGGSSVVGLGASLQFGAKRPVKTAKAKKGSFKEFLSLFGTGFGASLLWFGGASWWTDGSYSLWTRPMKPYSDVLTVDEKQTFGEMKEAFLDSPNVAFQGKVFLRKQGAFRAKMEGPFPQYRDQVADRIVEVLFRRADLLEKILARPCVIELYDSNNLPGSRTTVGLCNDQGVISLAMKTVQTGLKDNSDGYEVVCHELTHRLDLMDESGQLERFDGFLPGWDEETKARYIEARENEKVARLEGRSPLRSYALENDDEFLAVLVETYFERPADLKESSPVLYDLMNDFFKQNRDALAGPDRPSAMLYALGAGMLLMVTSSGSLLYQLHKK